MTADTTLSIGLIVLVIGCFLNIYNFVKNHKKDIQADDKALSEIHESLLKANMKLDNVCATTSETRTDIKATQLQVTQLDKELGIVKRDLKTAFDKIDELREDLKNGRE